MARRDDDEDDRRSRRRDDDDDDRGSRRTRSRDDDDDRGRDKKRSRDDDDEKPRMSKSKDFNYVERSVTDVKERANQRGGAYDSVIGGSFPIFKVKTGDNMIRILPREGEKQWGFEIWIHRNVGPDDQTYLCHKLMGKSEDCPVCDAHAELKADEPEAAAEIKATKQCLCWVLDRDAEKEGPKLWTMPWTMERDLQILSSDKRSGEVILIDHPEEGYDVEFTRLGEGRTTKYEGKRIARDSTPILEEGKAQKKLLAYIAENPVEECLHYYDNEYIEKVLNARAPKRDEDEDDDRGSRGRSRSRSRDDDDDADDRKSRSRRSSSRDDDDDEDDKKSSRRTSSSRDDDDDDEEDKKSSRRTSSSRDDDDDDKKSSRRSSSRDDDDDDEEDKKSSRRNKDDDDDDDADDDKKSSSKRRSRDDDDDDDDADDDKKSSSKRRSRDDDDDDDDDKAQADDDDDDDDKSSRKRRSRDDDDDDDAGDEVDDDDDTPRKGKAVSDSTRNRLKNLKKKAK